MQEIIDYFSNIKLINLLWPIAVIMTGYFLFQLLQKFFRNREKTSSNVVLQRQITNFIFILIFVLLFVIVLPIKDSLQGQIISLIGILLSASIALSSTTFLGNLMAGIWLRSVRNFRVGDVIEVEQYFGRVSSRGLMHIEIQNPERDLITLPNLFLVVNPVTVLHNEGTVISTEISLGYDIDHSVIEPLLCQAAENSGLENPFVYIESLGDFSIVYKIHGLTKEINKILSLKSKLNACVLDAMHKASIEIVSPNFMNQRQVNEQVFIPKPKSKSTSLPNIEALNPEDLVFDKAEKAERLDDMRKRHRELVEQAAQLKAEIKTADAEKKPMMEQQLQKLLAREEQMHQYLQQKEQEISQEGKDK